MRLRNVCSADVMEYDNDFGPVELWPDELANIDQHL